MITFTANRKILYVDDEQELLNAFTSLMRKENFQVKTLQNSSMIEEVLKTEGPFAVVFSDQRMPDFDGVRVLEITSQINPDALRVLITGYADYNDTIKAINIGGINSYITKPWNDDNVKKIAKDLVAQYNLKDQNKYLLKALDEENKELNIVLEGTVAQTVRILGDITNQISPQVAEFSSAVIKIGNAFLKTFTNLTGKERWEIKRALDLQNFGIALLPAQLHALISKHGLSVLDRSPVARNYHLLAAGLLKDIPRFENVARIIALQAKNFNGTGEPLNEIVRGEEIPFGARFLHIIIDLVRPSSGITRGTELLHEMEKLSAKYDVNIIKQILGKNIHTEQKLIEASLPITGLGQGMMLVDDVRTIEGQLLLKSDQVLNETLINIISQWHKKEPVQEPIKVKYMQ